MARVDEGFQFYLHIHTFIQHEWNETYLPLPSQPKPVLIYRSRKDERLSWPRHQHGEHTVCPGPLRNGYHSC